MQTLTHEFSEAERDDDRWLYLPSLRRVRRISGSNRGDRFLGTDFTYDDVQRETDLSPTDYNWTRDGVAEVDGQECLVLVGEPVDAKTLKDLGYSKVRVSVSAKTWIPLFTEYWDKRGDPLKRVTVSGIEAVDGVWTAHRIEAENTRTGHRTVFAISDVDYEATLDDLLFAKRSLDSIPAALR